MIQIATIERATTKVTGLPAILADQVKNFKREGVLCFIYSSSIYYCFIFTSGISLILLGFQIVLKEFIIAMTSITS